MPTILNPCVIFSSHDSERKKLPLLFCFPKMYDNFVFVFISKLNIVDSNKLAKMPKILDDIQKISHEQNYVFLNFCFFKCFINISVSNILNFPGYFYVSVFMVNSMCCE